MHDLATWFLFVSLFFPRLTLLFAYFTAQLPYAGPHLDGLIEFFFGLFIPRILILFMIYLSMGFCGWFLMHLLFAVLAYLGGTSYSSSKK